jgi:hypothetical protein
MIKITVDDSLRTRLSDFEKRIELCDETGRTVGFFVPASEEQRLLYAWAKDQFTDEEIEAARREPGGLSIEEVLAGLREE